jgi:endonuclease/exonuclease/phosphatase family metal-dependent hydrolase
VIRLLVPALLLPCFTGFAQAVYPPQPANMVRIAFYNVENLFDTEDDSTINDEEFLPEGPNRWTEYRYYEKLDHISKVFLNLGGWEMPALIGLCEVENRRVLQDLVRLTGLHNFDYEIVHENSPDLRGIDVALLYRRDIFRYLRHDIIRIRFPFAPEVRTRDVLLVSGLVAGDTLHVFVNHWPSRSGGQEASEPRRVFVAQQVRLRVDSILGHDSLANIIIMGDLNDGPEDRSVAEVLRASGEQSGLEEPGLLDGMYYLKFKKGLGTHKYAGEWNALDHLIMSSALLDTSQVLSVRPREDVVIFQGEWLLEDDPQSPGKKPFRTFAGPRYLGGFSDHLPVYVDLTVRPRW